MLVSLWLPIVLSAVALFFASFLSWMVLQLHKQDWKKLWRLAHPLAQRICLGVGVLRLGAPCPLAICNAEPRAIYRMIRLKATVRYSTISQGPRAIQHVSFATAPGA